MKYIFVAVLLIYDFILSVFNFFSRIYIYNFSKNTFKIRDFELKIGEKVLKKENSFNVTTQSFNSLKKDPIQFFILYSENFKFAKKLISIQFQLFSNNILVPETNHNFEIEYFDGTKLTKVSNNNEFIHLQIPYFQEDTIYNFSISNSFIFDKYPQTLKAKLIFTWIDEIKEFEIEMKKTKEKERKLNPKF